MNPQIFLLQSILGIDTKISQIDVNTFHIKFLTKPISFRSRINSEQLKKLHENKIKIFLVYEDKTVIAKFF